MQKPTLTIILNFEFEDEFRIFSYVLFLMLLFEFAQHCRKSTIILNFHFEHEFRIFSNVKCRIFSNVKCFMLLFEFAQHL